MFIFKYKPVTFQTHEILNPCQSKAGALTLSLLLRLGFFMESLPPVLAGCLCRFLRHYLLVLLFVFAGKIETCLKRLQDVRQV